MDPILESYAYMHVSDVFLHEPVVVYFIISIFSI